MEDLNP